MRVQEGERMADDGAEGTGEQEVAEKERDESMTETAGETEMGAATSNE